MSNSDFVATSTSSSFFYKCRSIIFDISLILLIILIPIIYMGSVIVGGRAKADHAGDVLSRTLLWMLKKICGITHQVKGLENIPKENGFIVACKHQSIWDTMIMFAVFQRPVYAYKKELLRMPFYGWLLGRMSGVRIDRQAGAKAMKVLLKNSNRYLKQKQNIIIFPQGTRVNPYASIDNYPYQAGIFAMYKYSKCLVVPVALNSGVFWNSKQKTKGVITIEFLSPIEPEFKREDFIAKLENNIEKKSKELADNA